MNHEIPNSISIGMIIRTSRSENLNINTVPSDTREHIYCPTSISPSPFRPLPRKLNSAVPCGPRQRNHHSQPI